jgi:putative acetyltransferase
MNMKGAVTVACEPPHRQDVRDLLRRSDAHMATLYPAESIHTLDIGELMQPLVRFLVARLGERAVGCGALVLGDNRSAELKRMYVEEAARGQGVGSAILSALQDMARQENVTLIRLETGVRQPEAIRLYRRFGFKERRAFGAYRDDPLSVFMEKHLAPGAPAPPGARR